MYGQYHKLYNHKLWFGQYHWDKGPTSWLAAPVSWLKTYDDDGGNDDDGGGGGGDKECDHEHEE